MSGGRQSPSKPPVYSDRFVPSRSASAGLRGFNLLDSDPPTASSSHPSSERLDTSAAYSTLLRTELLGDAAVLVGVSPTKTSSRGQVARQYSHSSPSRNLFRFKSDGVAGLGTPLESPYSLSPLGGDGPLGTALATPRRSPRKIARSPFRVLDAPGLKDDFFLNLVDWSAHNVLAVGLGTSVCLWSACTSRVTKLCDLRPNDSVCSVGWTQRGTYLAVGTNKGEVQIWDANRCKKIRTMHGHRTRGHPGVEQQHPVQRQPGGRHSSAGSAGAEPLREPIGGARVRGLRPQVVLRRPRAGVRGKR